MDNPRTLLTILSILILSIAGPLPVMGEVPSPGPVVVVDPGHGGQDTGARGVAGTVEKDISLEFSRLLADGLQGRYRVHMTRTGDIGLSPAERAGIANHAQGRLMISLHTGAAFRPSVGGCRVYVHHPPAAESRPDSDPATTAWHKRHLPHVSESKRLAWLMANRLQAGTSETVGVIKAPLALMAGVDMPAVLVEIGHITHPGNEQKYSDPVFRVRIVQAMVWAVNDFFGGRRAILSEDLKE